MKIPLMNKNHHQRFAIKKIIIIKPDDIDVATVSLNTLFSLILFFLIQHVATISFYNVIFFNHSLEMIFFSFFFFTRSLK